MWPRNHPQDEETVQRHRTEHLENFHLRRNGLYFGLVIAGVVLFLAWTLVFRVDEVARARGEVITTSRVQVIQSVDGGVLTHLLVKEGDRVQRGQILAKLDPTRIGAMVGETSAQLLSLKARAARLRAEVTGAPEPQFPKTSTAAQKSQIDLERALFVQRRDGLRDSLRTLQVALNLAREKQRLVEHLLKSGDVSGAELLGAQMASNEEEAKLVNQKNRYLEDARTELSKIEDQIAQNEHELIKRDQERSDTIFTANLDGIVKTVKVTTVGGVLRPGDEIMAIVPADDELIMEAMISPTDIARVRPGLEANIRFDPFDYTLFGSVPGKVIYVSADTLKDASSQKQEVYYRVHIRPDAFPIVTSTGKHLDILPGMTAQIDIRTGNRTLMDYLLKPLRRTLMESFRER